MHWFDLIWRLTLKVFSLLKFEGQFQLILKRAGKIVYMERLMIPKSLLWFSKILYRLIFSLLCQEFLSERAAARTLFVGQEFLIVLVSSKHSEGNWVELTVAAMNSLTPSEDLYRLIDDTKYMEPVISWNTNIAEFLCLVKQDPSRWKVTSVWPEMCSSLRIHSNF